MRGRLQPPVPPAWPFPVLPSSPSSAPARPPRPAFASPEPPGRRLSRAPGRRSWRALEAARAPAEFTGAGVWVGDEAAALVRGQRRGHFLTQVGGGVGRQRPPTSQTQPKLSGGWSAGPTARFEQRYLRRPTKGAPPASASAPGFRRLCAGRSTPHHLLAEPPPAAGGAWPEGPISAQGRPQGGADASASPSPRLRGPRRLSPLLRLSGCGVRPVHGSRHLLVCSLFQRHAPKSVGPCGPAGLGPQFSSLL